MTAVQEGFELLDSKGVDREVQHLFMDVWQEDETGRLSAAYRDSNGEEVDHEVLSLSKLKLSSEGVVHFSAARPENVRSMFISDAVTNLVFFAKSRFKRFAFYYSAFVATGARLDMDLFLSTMEHYPEVTKYHTVFGHSLIGRVKDCKIQHWINGRDCFFRVDGNEVVAFFQGKEFRMPVGEFSLRNHLRQMKVRQGLTTCKPKHKFIDNFYLFNYF